MIHDKLPARDFSGVFGYAGGDSSWRRHQASCSVSFITSLPLLSAVASRQARLSVTSVGPDAISKLLFNFIPHC